MITITEAAVIRIKEMMEENGESDTTFFRFGVTGGGCSGLSYSMSFDENVTDSDSLFQIDGINVVLNQADVSIVKETKIDYKQNMLGGGFTIDNPNAIASCGCGSSFRTKKESGTPTDC